MSRAIGQLRESQGEKLPTGETAQTTIAAIAFDALAELIGGQVIHQLREDGAAGVHAPLWKTEPGENRLRELKSIKPAVNPKVVIPRRLRRAAKALAGHY